MRWVLVTCVCTVWRFDHYWHHSQSHCSVLAAPVVESLSHTQYFHSCPTHACMYTDYIYSFYLCILNRLFLCFEIQAKRRNLISYLWFCITNKLIIRRINLKKTSICFSNTKQFIVSHQKYLTSQIYIWSLIFDRYYHS